MQRVAAAVHLHGTGRMAWSVADAAARLNLGGLELGVLYEDDHMAAVVKPQGVTCDPPIGRSLATSAATSRSSSAVALGDEAAASSSTGGESSSRSSSASGKAPRAAPPCVFTLLAHTLMPSQALGALRRPRHVHRLDEPTGGLLLVAKSQQAQQELGAAFSERRVRARCGMGVGGWPLLLLSRQLGYGMPQACLFVGR